MSAENFVNIFPNLFIISDRKIKLGTNERKILFNYKQLIELESKNELKGTVRNMFTAAYQTYVNLCKNLGYPQTFLLDGIIKS